MPDGADHKWAWFREAPAQVPPVATPDRAPIEAAPTAAPALEPEIEAPEADLPEAAQPEQISYDMIFDMPEEQPAVPVEGAGLMGAVSEYAGEIIIGAGALIVAAASGLLMRRRMKVIREARAQVADSVPPKPRPSPVPDRAAPPVPRRAQPAAAAAAGQAPGASLPRPKPAARIEGLPTDQSLRLDLRSGELPPDLARLLAKQPPPDSKAPPVPVPPPLPRTPVADEGKPTVQMQRAAPPPLKPSFFKRIADLFRGFKPLPADQRMTVLDMKAPVIEQSSEPHRPFPKMPAPPRLSDAARGMLSDALAGLEKALPFKELREQLRVSVNRHAVPELVSATGERVAEGGERVNKKGERISHEIARVSQQAQGPYAWVWKRGAQRYMIKSLIQISRAPDRERYLDAKGYLRPDVKEAVVMVNSDLPAEVKLANRMRSMAGFARLGKKALLESAAALHARWQGLPPIVRQTAVMEAMSSSGALERGHHHAAAVAVAHGVKHVAGTEHVLQFKGVGNQAVIDQPPESWLISEREFMKRENKAWEKAAKRQSRLNPLMRGVHLELYRNEWFRGLSHKARFDVAARLAPLLHEEAFRKNTRFVNETRHLTREGVAYAFDRAGLPLPKGRTLLGLPGNHSGADMSRDALRARVEQVRRGTPGRGLVAGGMSASPAGLPGMANNAGSSGSQPANTPRPRTKPRVTRGR